MEKIFANHLIKNLYPAYIKNIYNSTVQRLLNILNAQIIQIDFTTKRMYKWRTSA